MKTQHGRELNGQEMAQMLAEWINGAHEGDANNFLFEITHTTHRTLQQLLMRLICDLIMSWSTMTNYDDRNAATIKLAKRLMKDIDKYDLALPYI